jgi:Flp pilus assembly protein TadG
MPAPARCQQKHRDSTALQPASPALLPQRSGPTIRSAASASTPDAVRRTGSRQARPGPGDPHGLAHRARPRTAAASRASHGNKPRRAFARRGDRGAGAAEVVIAVPLLMLIILLIVQFAVWEHATAVAQATAEEALAAARVQGGSAAAGQQRAIQVLGQIGSPVLTGPQVSVTRTAAIATVQIHATAERVVPLPGLSLPVTVTVTGPVERFVPDSAGS